MKGIILRAAGVAVVALTLLGWWLPQPAHALIAYPSSDPEVIQFNAYRNVLETGDFLVIVYENTPYATAPGVNYSEAYVWRMYDTDGTSELAQASGYNYHSRGYGYNAVNFYFSAAELATLGLALYPTYWEQAYVFRLSGTFGADTFLVPRNYNFTISPSDYSSLTDTAEVKVAIAQRIIDIATDLNNKWGLATDYELTYSSETGTTLSIYGQSFFRGAIYGVQAMAPSIFPLAISNVDVDARTWTTAYAANLEGQYAGTYLEPAFTAGEGFFDVSYNVMGILIILIVCAFIIGVNWWLGGGNLWRGILESASPVIIGARLALLPLGEVGLLIAMVWLYISAKVWKLI